MVLSACPLESECRFAPCCKQNLLTFPTIAECLSSACVSNQHSRSFSRTTILGEWSVFSSQEGPQCDELHFFPSPHKMYNLKQFFCELEMCRLTHDHSHCVGVQQLWGCGLPDLRASSSALQSLRNLTSSAEGRKSSTRLSSSGPSLHPLCQIKAGAASEPWEGQKMDYACIYSEIASTDCCHGNH